MDVADIELRCEHGTLSFAKSLSTKAPLEPVAIFSGRFGYGPGFGSRDTQLLWVDEQGKVAWAGWSTESQTLAETATVIRDAVPGTLVATALADVDADGWHDLVTVHGSDDVATLRWISGKSFDGDPAGIDEQVVELRDRLDGPAAQAAFGQYDGDASIDVLVASGTRWQILAREGLAQAGAMRAPFDGRWFAARVPKSVQHAAFAVDPSGTISKLDHEQGTLSVLEGVTLGSGEVHPGDVDGDGLADVVALDSESRAVSLVLDLFNANGSTSFSFDSSIEIHVATMADLDDDGLDELLMSDASGNLLVVQCDRQGKPEFGRLTSADTIPVSLAVDDLNADRLDDIILAERSGQTDVLLATCACDPGWVGPECNGCEDLSCGSVGGPTERVWISTPPHLREPVRRASRQLVEHTLAGQDLSQAQLVAVQGLVLASLRAELVTVITAEPSTPVASPRPSLPLTTRTRMVGSRARVERVVRGGGKKTRSIDVVVIDPRDADPDTAAPPPVGRSILAPLIREGDAWTPVAPMPPWFVNDRDEVEVAGLAIPLDALDEALRDAARAPSR